MPSVLIDSPPDSASAIMSLDARLLEELEQPTLHLYEWERPSITHGYFIKPEEHLDLKALERHGIDIARRPTGGGIVFHTHDLAFSLLIPDGHPACGLNTLDRYHFVNRRLLKGIEAFLHGQKAGDLCTIEPKDETNALGSFCMAKPTRYDVMFEGRKVGGAAQRKKAQGFLHQGTVCLQVPPKELLADVLLDPRVAKAMGAWSFPLAAHMDLQEARLAIRAQLKDVFL